MGLVFPGEAARRQRVERRKQRMQEQMQEQAKRKRKRKLQRRVAKKPLKGTERSLAYSREYYRKNRESCLAYGRWYRAMVKKRKQLKSGG